MRMKKYEITDIAHPDNPKLHRIRALMDLTENIHAGDLGGFVETEDNLDQEGFAWIGKDAIACEDSYIGGDAILADSAVARDSAYVGNNAVIADHAVVQDNAIVCGGYISGNSCICGSSPSTLCGGRTAKCRLREMLGVCRACSDTRTPRTASM